MRRFRLKAELQQQPASQDCRSEGRPLDVFSESFNGFPKLPILSPAEIPSPPRKTQREKYGGLFYIGIAGLVFMIALVVMFGIGVWNLRGVGTDIYVLHDRSRPESDRVQAAFRLSRDARVGDAERMNMSLERDLPDLARYLLAEVVSTDLVAHDPRTFALAVARSPEWPDWLRLLLARRLTYGAGRGYAIPDEALLELSAQPDPMIDAWANAARALMPGSDAAGAAELEKASHQTGPYGELATRLLEAIHASTGERETRLDEATVWLRAHHPLAAKIWEGWKVVDGRITRVSTR